jgi:excisionase family DNA binding protein
MTVEEVAHYLRIPLSSVYKLAQDRTIPSQKVGRRWRFRRSAIDVWLAGEGTGVRSSMSKRSPAKHRAIET